ncbi:F0F1 ATP synthase subunit B' [Campylobacter hyointestinalis]|uniref:FoF1 ATP synthase subunit B' n=1 Tax=Campylobacter hyointestinalis TaxID=198 RepID=UPI0007240A3C|nr:FoF1 ATP synthase subunit B' [Campylobacter hyointestinalis]PPB53281.1 F0F1 ATP synthase subunit B' [Campylobacter hyointestinalis subsp. hyointestinalis]PPB55207.1 F0F1 ATP synthase subunit B' [Campylobacter hyointestinalis subsp. hyointestinalis]PPB60907.1 F0F1 ATP synthase subunit B' [Campylobacter hyointestinalis subsp. hyointestinalis]PPB64486.1 F0F1 ATP synthase subunit B' [Campylobacter hyointestinalis subsp. hyointestinalis]PPB66665.1 F0F1 ATP synthase subunit B' [Campylobacter hyoi
MLEINLPLLIVTVVIFLGLIFVLNSILYKPLLRFIDDRNISIKNDEESVSKNANDVGAYQADIERIISSARAEANSIKQTALNLAKDEAAKKIQAKKETLESEYELFSKDLVSRKDELKSMLLAKLPEFKSSLGIKLSKI